MLKTIIVDSNIKSHKHLEQLLETEHASTVKVLGNAYDTLSGIKLINMHQPDIVFLDTEMPTYSGFKLIEFYEKPAFKIIFTTKNQAHAIKAFKVDALAYLLKPVQKTEIQAVIQKAAALSYKQNTSDLQNAVQKRFKFPSNNGWWYLSIDEIYYLKSDGRNTTIELTNETSLTTTSNLKECQAILQNTSLLRIHRSYILNLLYIKRYVKRKDSYIQMINDVRLDVGRNFKEDLNQAISYFER